MKYLAEYFECSTREVKDYIELTPKNELVGILDNFKVTTSKKKVKKWTKNKDVKPVYIKKQGHERLLP